MLIPVSVGCALAIVAFAMSAVVRKNLWRLEQREWRLRTKRNRSRHPGLAREYDAEQDPWKKFIIAQSMMMDDRVRERQKHNDASGPNYPTVWDYYHRPGQSFFLLMKTYTVNREENLTRLREKLVHG